MDHKILEHLEGILVKAVQAGKQETSGLVGDIKRHLTLQDTKLEELHDEFTVHKLVVENHYKEDKEWKDSAMPVIEMGRNVSGFGKVSLYVLGFFASAVGAVMLWFDFLKKE